MKSTDAALLLNVIGFAIIIVLLVFHSSLPSWLFLVLGALGVGCYASLVILKLRSAISFRESDRER